MGRKKAYSYDPNNKARGKGRRRGNISTDVDATELTGSVTWYAAPSIPEGHKVVVTDGHTMGRTTTGNATPQYIVLPTSSAELINVVNRIPGIGANVSTEAGAYAALASSDACFVSSPNDSNFVSEGLVLEVDAQSILSYPTTGTTVYDISGNGFTGTLQNGVGFDSIAKALTFDGSNDQIAITNSSNFSNFTWSNGLSLVVVYKVDPANLTSNGQYRAFLGVSSGTRSFNYYLRRSSAGNLQFHFSALGYGSLSSTYAANSSKYYMATFVQQSNGTGNYYLNNASIGSHSQNGVTPSYSSGTTTQYIGRADNLTSGNIAKVLIYNEPLSENERSQIYYKGPIVTDGLVFAADAGNLVSYESGSTLTYSLTGSYSGSVLNGVTHNPNGWWDFDGTNDKIELSDTSYWKDNVFGNATNFTIMCWTKCDNFYNWSSMIHKDNGGYYSESEGASLWINSSGFQAVFGNGIPGNSGNWGNIISYSTSNTTDWFHLAFTGDGSTLKFYVNNVLVGSQGQSNRSAGKDITNNPVRIGVRANSAWYNGKIALPLFYTRSLTAEEVAQNFEAHRSRFGK